MCTSLFSDICVISDDSFNQVLKLVPSNIAMKLYVSFFLIFLRHIILIFARVIVLLKPLGTSGQFHGKYERVRNRSPAVLADSIDLNYYKVKIFPEDPECGSDPNIAHEFKSKFCLRP